MPGRRLFVAVPLPTPVRDEVVALVERVRAEVRPPADPGESTAAHEVRWVRMDGLHLTLRFLGPTPDEKMPAIVEAMRRACRGLAPFDVELAGAGAFPSPDRPRVLWLGITRGAEPLSGLAGSLEEGLASVGWPRDERPFRPHLSLARSDGVRAGPATVRALVRLAAGFRVAWRADRLVLFESLTGHGPARYEPVEEVALTL